VDGGVVFRDRRLTRADLAEIVSRVREVAPELIDLSAGGAVQHADP
jgi:5-methylthioadenosine/S-adenosylhomocysteine deaminase